MVINSDIYNINKYMEEVKKKFTGLDDTTLAISTFGYLGEVHSNILQNAIVMSSEYSNEAIAVKAKFEKNIITHALGLGINKIYATPASMQVILFFPEDDLIKNMKNDVFTFDKDIKIMVGEYEYHVDYDIQITKNKLPTGDYTFTALYDMSKKNYMSNITSPYLPPIGVARQTGINLIVVTCIIRQVENKKYYKKLLSTNPLENKIIGFEFSSQLAYFDLTVEEAGKTIDLKPIHDGLYDYTATNYCNYTYIDSNTIRVKFNPDSYQPSLNADITVNIYTTKGSECNFEYNKDILLDLISDRFQYDKLFMVVRPISGSLYGVDRKSIDDLKQIIPKEALSRGNITNNQDLQNFFNSLNSDISQMYIYKKIDNQFERAYYAYLLLKSSSNIIPTNTLDVKINRNQFNYIGPTNFVLKSGNAIYYKNTIADILPESQVTAAKINELEKDGNFVYTNPFMCVVNKSPFYVSYYLTIFDYNKLLYFDYINKNSQIQFISSSIRWRREFFTERNIYKLNVEIIQNINTEFNLIVKDDQDNIIGNKIKVAVVMYDKDQNPIGYNIADMISYDDAEKSYQYQFNFITDDGIDNKCRIKIKNTYKPGTIDIGDLYYDSLVSSKIYVLTRDNGNFNREDLDKIIPGLDDYTLTNTYSVVNGIDFYKDYSNILMSTVEVTKNMDTSLIYHISKIPLIKYKYINSEERVKEFIDELEKRRVYIEYCLPILEDSFRIDFKFFNTYGPSRIYDITDSNRINKVNIDMKFRVKFVSATDRTFSTNIINDIKGYVEDISSISDLHVPNIITFITNKYRERLVYFEFIDINGFGPGCQHIYKTTKVSPDTVPEFLNINTSDENLPDITLVVV